MTAKIGRAKTKPTLRPRVVERWKVSYIKLSCGHTLREGRIWGHSDMHMRPRNYVERRRCPKCRKKR